jgi:hypothetical protein
MKVVLVYFFRNMNENESTTPKRKRTPFENREKEILCQILKETDGGRVWKIIKEGIGTSHEKFVAWEKVTKLFNEATGKNCDRKKIRGLFDRIKCKKKQNHDRDSQERGERNFSRACGLTGGGPSPLVPPVPDGDDDLNFDDLDPTPTQFNSFTPAYDNMSPSTPMPPRTPFRPTSTGPMFRFPAPSPFRYGTPPPGLRTCSPASPSQISSEEDSTPSHTSELPDLHYVPIFRATPTSSSPSRQRARPPAEKAAVPSGTAAAAASSSGTSSAAPASQMNQTEVPRIDLITAGERTSIQVVEEVPPKKSKKGTKKNMNETAIDYYSEMLKIQKNLAELKGRVLKRRERVEILKERLLMRQLEKEGGTVPEWVDDAMEREGREENSSDERNFCFQFYFHTQVLERELKFKFLFLFFLNSGL